MLGNPRLRSLATAQAARHGHAYGNVYTLVLGDKILGNIRAVAFDDAGYEAAERGWLKDTDFGKKAAIVGPTTVTGVRITPDGRPSFTRLLKSDEDAAKAVAGRVKNPKGPKKNPSIREAQAAEQILGWDATCDIVGSGGLSGASGYNLARLVAAAKKEDRKTFDKLVRISASYDRKANPVPFAPGTHVQIRKDYWTGLGIRDGIVEGHTGTFAGYNHRTYWRKADGSLHDIDTRALEPVRKSNPSWKPVGPRPLGDGAWSRGAWRIELADRHYLRKGVQYDLFHHDTFVNTFKTRAAAEKVAAAKRTP